VVFPICPDPARRHALAGSELVEAARDWINVPFRHQGRSRYGVDCAGLVVCAFKDLGIEISDRIAYDRRPFNGELEGQAVHEFVRVQDALPGDVFLMSFAGHPVSHVSIFTGDTIIHSYSTIGRVIEQRFRDGRPAKRIRTLRYHQWQ